MGWLDPSLPQAAYVESELISRRGWRHTHVLADQFWTHLIWRYLPDLLRVAQEPCTAATWNHCHDRGPPAAKSSVAGQVTGGIPATDGRVRTAGLQICTRPVVRLAALPAAPDRS